MLRETLTNTHLAKMLAAKKSNPTNKNRVWKENQPKNLNISI